MNQPHAPEIMPGSVSVAQTPLTLPNFSTYSDKQIVHSSMPVRESVAQTQMMANDLEQKMNAWQVSASKNPFAKMM